jgi:hypothetical protein
VQRLEGDPDRLPIEDQREHREDVLEAAVEAVTDEAIRPTARSRSSNSGSRWLSQACLLTTPLDISIAVSRESRWILESVMWSSARRVTHLKRSSRARISASAAAWVGQASTRGILRRMSK